MVSQGGGSLEKNNFYKKSFILSSSNILTGVLGFVFSIILSKELGSEALGLYGLLMPIYNLFICLMCGGILASISRITAVYFDNKYFNKVNLTMKTSMVFTLIWSLIIAIIVYTLAPIIAQFIIKDNRIITSIKIICPAMIFISISNILKGYFYGTSQINVPSIIDILEKSMRIIVLIFVIKVFKFQTVESTVTAAYISICLGEFLSYIFLYAYYKKINSKYIDNRPANISKRSLLFDMLKIAFPLCINGLITTFLATVTTLIIPRRLLKAGFDYSQALSLMGKFNGMALNIVLFPIIIISSISTLLIPDLSKSMNKNNIKTAEKRIREVIKIAFILGLATLVICFVIPDELSYMFFKRNDLGNYIWFASLITPMFFISLTTYSILNGLGKQNKILRNSLICSFIEISLIYFLAGFSKINIYSYAIAIFVDSCLSVILNLREIKKTIKIQTEIPKYIIYILLSILMILVLYLIKSYIPPKFELLQNLLIIFSGFSVFGITIVRDIRQRPFSFR